jgi:PAS domain S-box-containing protein
MLGPELRIDFANPPFEELLGRAMPGGQPFREVFPELAADAPVLQLFASVYDGAAFAADEYQIPLPDAGGAPVERYFKLNCQPMRRADGAVFGIMLVAVDVSQSVRMRQAALASTSALRRTETRLRSAIEAADVGTFFLDIDADRMTTDGLLARLLGIDAELASIGIPLQRFIEAIEPVDRERVLSLISSALRDGREYSDEHRVRDAQGQLHWVSAKGRVERDGNGRPAFFLGAFADVSETRRATEALQNATRVKDEFLAMLGHELRNPLAPIVTALHLLRLRPHVGLEREIGIIERQVAHLLRLVDDLLDVSRITRGKIELRKERVEVSRVIFQAMEIAMPMIQLKRQKLNAHAAATRLVVDADPARLTQILTNLLTNASRYSPEDSAIAVAAERRGERISIRVRDWGQGIGPELLPAVFDLFSQGPQAIDRSQGGLGLGLAIVKNLVEMHGGTVTAASDGIGQGSEFTITLPLAQGQSDGPEQQPETANGAATQSHGACRILIVDDNRDAADMLALVLSDFGHEVRVAYEAHAGLQLAAQFRPQCALLDIGLPTMSGYELAAHIREIAGLECRLFAVTGYGQTGDRERALAAGFTRHFVKPTSIDELQAAIVAAS